MLNKGLNILGTFPNNPRANKIGIVKIRKNTIIIIISSRLLNIKAA